MMTDPRCMFHSPDFNQWAQLYHAVHGITPGRFDDGVPSSHREYKIAIDRLTNMLEAAQERWREAYFTVHARIEERGDVIKYVLDHPGTPPETVKECDDAASAFYASLAKWVGRVLALQKRVGDPRRGVWRDTVAGCVREEARLLTLQKEKEEWGW